MYPDPVPIRICLEGKHTDQSKERSLKGSLCIEVDEAFPIVIIDRTVSAVLDFQRIDIRMQDRFHFLLFYKDTAPVCHYKIFFSFLKNTLVAIHDDALFRIDHGFQQRHRFHDLILTDSLDRNII